MPSPEPRPTLPGPVTVFVVFPSAVITDNLPHGDGRLGWGYVCALSRLGFRIHLAARQISIDGEVPGNVILHSFPESGAGGLKTVRFILWARSLLRQIQKREPVHLIHELNPVFTGLSLAFVGSGLPLILGPIPPSWPAGSNSTDGRPSFRDKLVATVKKAVSKAQQSRAAAVLPMGAGALDRIYVPATARRVVEELPPGIDVSLFAPMEAVVARPASILFLANLSVRKGILTLLDAMPSIIETVPKATLTIAGGGPLMDEVAKRVADMPFSGKIKMLGPVPREQVPALMAAHSVYCLPSYGDPFPGSVLEAMSCGKPVVLTETSGLRSMVTPDAGRLVPERDPRALAAALIELLSSPTLVETMGKHNRKMLVAKCSWSSVTQTLGEIYANVLRSSQDISSVAAD